MINTIKKLLGVNVLTQLIGLLVYPILVTQYSVEDIALFGVLFAGMGIVSSVASFKIQNLIFSIRLKKAYAIYANYFRWIYVPSVVLLSGVFIACYNELHNTVQVVILSVLSGFFLSGFNLYYSFLVRIRNEKYNYVKLSRACLELIFVVLAVLFGFDIIQLFALVAFSYFIPSAYGVFHAAVKHVHLDLEIETVKKLLIDLVSGFFNSVYLNSPNYFLYFGSSKELAAYYFLINKFVGTPTLMVAQSLNVSLNQHLVEKQTPAFEKTIAEFKNKIFNKLFSLLVLGTVVAIPVVYMIDKYFYNNLVYIYIVMIPWLVCRFRFVTFVGICYLLAKYRLVFSIQLALFITSMVASLIAFLLSKSLLGLGIYLLSSIMVYYVSSKKISLLTP